MIAHFLFLFNAQNVCALRIAKTNAALKICSSQVVDKISDFGSVENVDTRLSYPLSCSDFEDKNTGAWTKEILCERSWKL